MELLLFDKDQGSNELSLLSLLLSCCFCPGGNVVEELCC